MMKKTNRIKLALDILMLIILLLMYRKNVLGLSFHEIGGLAVCGLFIIHKLLNGKWILVVTGKLFSKKTAWRCKLNWLIDFLLLVCFVFILLSGIQISKVLFDGQRGQSTAKLAHYAISALALVLLGVHLGLHYESIINRTPVRKLPLTLRRIAAVGMSAVILGFGVYSMTSTNFLEWMGDLGTVVTDTVAPSDGMADTALSGSETDTDLTRTDRGNGARDGSGKGKGAQARNSESGTDVAALPGVLFGFLSITLVFSVLTAWIDGIQRTQKRNKRLRCKIPA
jgi:hypothetical protein